MMNREYALKVKKYPLPINPPMMVFVAQFHNLPQVTANGGVVEFYYVIPSIRMHASRRDAAGEAYGNILTYIGSASIGKNRVATLRKRMNPGNYTIVARARINDCETWSNEVNLRIA